MGLGAFALENHLGDTITVSTDEDDALVLTCVTGRAGPSVTYQIPGTVKPQRGSSVRIACNGDHIAVYVDEEIAIKATKNIPTGLDGCEAKAVWL